MFNKAKALQEKSGDSGMSSEQESRSYTPEILIFPMEELPSAAKSEYHKALPKSSFQQNANSKGRLNINTEIPTTPNTPNTSKLPRNFYLLN